MMRFLTDIPNLQAPSWIWSLLQLVLVLGFLIMVTLQTAKDILPWRKRFQSGWMRRWLEKGLRRFEALRVSYVPPQELQSRGYRDWVNPFAKFEENVSMRTKRSNDLGEEPGIPSDDSEIFPVVPKTGVTWNAVDIAIQDLADLATAGSKKALLSLPIEKLCGQTNAAMQMAMDHPGKHLALIVCFSHLTDPTDLGLLLQPIAELARDTPNLSQDEKDAQKERLAVYSAARQRLAHHVQRAVDGFQISVDNKWKLVLQLCAMALGVLSVFALLSFELGSCIRNNIGGAIFTSLVIGCLAGFTSSVIRDVLSVLTLLKK